MPYLPPFYRFLVLHSLLIGLLPFFMPVWLWNAGFGLTALCAFIAVTGVVFVIALDAWQAMLERRGAGVLVAVSLVAELLLVGLMALPEPGLAMLVLLGVGNGVYNAFFWTTQRLLFLQLVDERGSGRQYGNFQIFVALFLKLGILAGGWLLEVRGLGWLLALSTLAVIAGLLHFHALDRRGAWQTPGVQRLGTQRPGLQRSGKQPSWHRWRDSLYVRDGHSSAPVFAIDGLFLFLESHFWTLSLFWLVEEDFSRLGAVVVFLAIAFALLFYVLKNTIDRITGTRFYQVAVVAYALSWALRALPDADMPPRQLLPLLLLVSFCSSLFRLAFNKRFFDLAHAGDGLDYLLLKSRASQSWLAALFGIAALVFAAWPASPAAQLDSLYVLSSVLALIYLLYRPARVSAGT